MNDPSVYRPKRNALAEIFGRSRNVVIGVLHCPPLPGSPGYEGENIQDLIERTTEEATRYQRGGVHGIIVENHGDIPFAKPEDLGHETTASMAVIADHIRRHTTIPIGVNILANGARPAIAAAKAAGATFVRVNQWANAYVANEGIIEGEAARSTRYRAWLRASEIRVFADVHVKHGAHAIVADRSIEEMARDAEFFDADVLIATGQRTGNAASLDEARTIQAATRLPTLVGSGVTVDNVADLLGIADGVIVASSLKEEGVWWTPVSETRVRAFMDTVGDLP